MGGQDAIASQRRRTITRSASRSWEGSCAGGGMDDSRDGANVCVKYTVAPGARSARKWRSVSAGAWFDAQLTGLLKRFRQSPNAVAQYD
jgi:hypothetical protein